MVAGDFAVLQYPQHLLDPWWEGGLMARRVPANWLQLWEEPEFIFQVVLRVGEQYLPSLL